MPLLTVRPGHSPASSPHALPGHQACARSSSAATAAPAWPALRWTAAWRSSRSSASAAPQAQRSALVPVQVPPVPAPVPGALMPPARRARHTEVALDQGAHPDTTGQDRLPPAFPGSSACRLNPAPLHRAGMALPYGMASSAPYPARRHLPHPDPQIARSAPVSHRQPGHDGPGHWRRIGAIQRAARSSAACCPDAARWRYAPGTDSTRRHPPPGTAPRAARSQHQRWCLPHRMAPGTPVHTDASRRPAASAPHPGRR